MNDTTRKTIAPRDDGLATAPGAWARGPGASRVFAAALRGPVLLCVGYLAWYLLCEW